VALYNNNVELIRCDQCVREIVVFALARDTASAPKTIYAMRLLLLPTTYHLIDPSHSFLISPTAYIHHVYLIKDK